MNQNISIDEVVVHPSPTHYIRAEIREILSPENRWFAGEYVKREPTNEDCFEQWFMRGGLAHFIATHRVASQSSHN